MIGELIANKAALAAPELGLWRVAPLVPMRSGPRIQVFWAGRRGGPGDAGHCQDVG
jgi:hypothetical protein